MNCPICNGEVQSEFRGQRWNIDENGRSFEYLSCTPCQLTFCNPIPTAEEISLYYSTKFDYKWFTKRKQLKRMQAYHRWMRVGSYLEKIVGHKGNILDIGCGHGWFIESARRHGWQVTGIDLSPSTLDYASKNLKLDVHQGFIETADLPVHYYDVITMWHCLEHNIDPKKTLEKARALLKPDGIILVAVPNIECSGYKTRGKLWVWFQAPFVHIWHFSPKSIKSYLKKYGFDILDIKTRDTWDAQYIYDGIMIAQLESRYFVSIARFIASLLKRFGYKYELVKDNIQFFLSETCRIVMYIFYLVFLPIVRSSRKKSGSELLIIGRVRNI